MAVPRSELSPSAPIPPEMAERLASPEAYINGLYDESVKLLLGKKLVADFDPQEVEDWEQSGDHTAFHWPILLQRGRIYRGEWADYSIVVGIRPMEADRHWEVREPEDGLSFQFATLPFNKDRLRDPDLDYLKLLNRSHNHGTGEVVFHTLDRLSVSSWATSHFNGSPDIRGTSIEKHMTPEGFENLIDLVADVFDRSFRKPRSVLRPSAS